MSSVPAPPAAWLDRAAAMLAAYAARCAARPRLTLAMVAALSLVSAAFAALDLRINTRSQDMLSPALDFRQRELALAAAFPGNRDRLVTVIEAPSADVADAFTARLLDAIGAQGPALEEPFAPAVDPYFARNGLLYLPDEELEPIVARINAAGPLVATLAAEPSLSALFAATAQGVREADRLPGGGEALNAALDEIALTIEAGLEGGDRPLAWSRLFAAETPERVRRVLSVRAANQDYAAARPAREAIAALDRAIADAQADPAFAEIEVAVTGDPALRSQELASVTTGLGVALVTSLLGVGALVWLAYGGFTRAALTLAVVVASLCVAAGFAALVFDALNLVSMAFAVLLTGLGADYALHVLLRAQEVQARGEGAREGLLAAVDDLAGPLLLCALTTALGFLAFTPTAFRGIAQLGLIGAVGVLTALALTIAIAAAGLALFEPPARRPPASRLLAPGLRRLAPYGGYARPLTLGLVALAAIAAPFARFETDPMALRDPASPAAAAFGLLFDDASTRPYRALVLAQDLAAAEEIAARARSLEGVARVVTAASFTPEEAYGRFDLVDAVAAGLLPQLEPGARAPLATAGGLDALQAALAESLAPGESRLAAALDRLETAAAADPETLERIEAAVFRFWPQQLDRLRQQLAPDPELTIDGLPTALRERYLAEDGRALVEITPEADLRDPAARRAFVATLRQEFPDVAGDAAALEGAGAAVSSAMLQAVALALVLCAGLLFAAWRDLRRVREALSPVVAAGLVTIGASALFGPSFNYANVIALPLLLGAGLDSAIHVAHRARQGGDAGATPRAVVFSALTTIAAFGTLTFSAHRGVASIGALLMVALSATIVCTLALAPRPPMDRADPGRER